MTAKGRALHPYSRLSAVSLTKLPRDNLCQTNFQQEIHFEGNIMQIGLFFVL